MRCEVRGASTVLHYRQPLSIVDSSSESSMSSADCYTSPLYASTILIDKTQIKTCPSPTREPPKFGDISGVMRKSQQ